MLKFLLEETPLKSQINAFSTIFSTAKPAPYILELSPIGVSIWSNDGELENFRYLYNQRANLTHAEKYTRRTVLHLSSIFHKDKLIQYCAKVLPKCCFDYEDIYGLRVYFQVGLDISLIMKADLKKRTIDENYTSNVFDKQKMIDTIWAAWGETNKEVI